MANHDPTTVDLVLFATGRLPNTAGWGWRSRRRAERMARVERRDNQSTVRPSMRSVDVTNRIQLTPVAIREGPGVRGHGVRRQADAGRL
jgi:glutathione reductase (NADPH)